MKLTLRALAFATVLLPGIAAAQSPQYPQTICGSCVIGRLGTSPGPSEQIPFATLQAQIFGTVESANTFYAGPASGGGANPTFRALVGADLPVPGPSSLGGVLSVAAVAHTYMTGISPGGVPTLAIPVCADLSDATADCNAAAGQLPATATNDFAGAGKVGEEIESVIAQGSAVSLTTTVAANVTSITLTPGDWDVTGVVQFTTASTTSITRLTVGLSTTTASIDNTNGRSLGGSMAAVVPGAAQFAMGLSIPPLRFSVSTNTVVYLVTQDIFSTAALSAYGIIRARRMR